MGDSLSSFTKATRRSRCCIAVPTWRDNCCLSNCRMKNRNTKSGTQPRARQGTARWERKNQRTNAVRQTHQCASAGSQPQQNGRRAVWQDIVNITSQATSVTSDTQTNPEADTQLRRGSTVFSSQVMTALKTPDMMIWAIIGAAARRRAVHVVRSLRMISPVAAAAFAGDCPCHCVCREWLRCSGSYGRGAVRCVVLGGHICGFRLSRSKPTVLVCVCVCADLLFV
jgi:hypothetical protein